MEAETTIKNNEDTTPNLPLSILLLVLHLPAQFAWMEETEDSG